MKRHSIIFVSDCETIQKYSVECTYVEIEEEGETSLNREIVKAYEAELA